MCFQHSSFTSSNNQKEKEEEEEEEEKYQIGEKQPKKSAFKAEARQVRSKKRKEDKHDL